MASFFYTTLTLLFLPLLPLTKPYTVLIPDSGNQSALIDGPQTGLSMNKIGARTDGREQEAVYDIMRATGNDWATDIPDICRGRWHGIECMPDKDNVYHIVSLSFGALSDDTAFPTCDPTRSYISKSITKLPHIRTLFFYRCFSYNPQPIPSFLGQLGPSLQTLILRENGHVGPIPIELGNLTRLKVLDLHRNNLNGSIPFQLSGLTGLRSLDLSGNKLTGSIPSLSFPSLSVLDLSQNLLSGSIPSTIGSCDSLIKLDLSRNRLVGSIPETIGTLKELILVDLSYNRFSGPFPMSIRSLNSLQALILKGNPLWAKALASDEFDGMKSLMILVLSNMNLQGSIPESLGRLINLRVVYLDGNHLNGSIPINFKNLKNLGELKLNDNHLTGPVPFSRDMVWKMRRKLKLQDNSGLCYGVDSGFEGGSEESFDSAISPCNPPLAGSTKTTVHHLSTTLDAMTLPSTENKSSGADRQASCLQTAFVMFVLCLIL
ncbi:hypothetical protein K2173_024624 [Erythroxylum novogranatense]|uniref:Disease resistance R13L4/SHOC-2-like LRR domain-containing protein n=1 Tax=Erythroxylum novogranatense TaxID=1862640 RepID=A0AAV8SUY8_9ROSI|nr:hypothetical protein K2173_024624 [Erythroxylum novogranatense]